jgi:UDP-N-acetylglucosamine/UDP-N-acetylgalactosamine diphosphorylase
MTLFIFWFKVHIDMTQTGLTAADITRLRASFEAAGQGHVFAFWDSLTTEQQQELYSQLNDLDIFRVNQIYNTAVKSAADSTSTQASNVHSLPAGVCDSVLTADTSSLQEWRELGLKLISEGKVAVILMAGCKGTRLGSSGPRGCYDIDSPSGKILFHLQAERIAKLQELARTSNNVQQNVIIAWYILTSGRTHGPIYSFFESNNFFGLDKENVLFYEQGKSSFGFALAGSAAEWRTA